MFYPKQTDNYDIEIFNSNFRELKAATDALGGGLQQETDRARTAEDVNADQIAQERERAVEREDAIENSFNAETRLIRQLISSANAGTGINQAGLEAHIADDAVHVTLEEKEGWNVPSFTQAATRENIGSGNFVPVLWGKVQKFFADLKTVAFTGSYNDLIDKPAPIDISDKLDKSGGTITGDIVFQGNVRIQKNGANYGSVINIGDGTYIQISEDTDDVLTIKANRLNLNATNGVYVNGAAAGATVLTDTLSAYSTSLSFTNASISSSATIDVYTDVYGAAPTAMSISGNTLYLTFASRSSSVGVKVRVS